VSEPALQALIAAASDPTAVAAEARAAGRRIVWILGWDIPRFLVDAFGLQPIRLVTAGRGASGVDALIAADSMSKRGRAVLAAIEAIPESDALLITHADADQPQIFATLRELARIGAMKLPPVHFLDLLTIDRAATHIYNRRRVEQACAWLETLSGRHGDLATAMTDEVAMREALRALLGARKSGRLTGAEAHAIIAATAVLPTAGLAARLDAARVEVEGRDVGQAPRMVLSGSEIEDPQIIASIEAAGILVATENHGWGESRARPLPALAPLEAAARAPLEPLGGPFATIADRASWLSQACGDFSADKVLHLRLADADGVAWEAAAIAQAASGVPFLDAEWPADREKIGAFCAGQEPVESQSAPRAESVAKPASARPRPAPARSRKSLSVIERFGTYQREWFAGVREAAAEGIAIAAVNANSPQEMLRALGIPFVVNQWWASIVAAKQQSRRYGDLLRAHGLPAASEAYSAQGVAAAFDEDSELAPWGGLPTPKWVEAVMHTDATSKLFETWAQATGAELHRFQRSVESRWEIPIPWWDDLAEDWDHFIEPERLDLLEAELRDTIARLESEGNLRFDGDRFTQIMDLVNEQEDYYRATRDLVARTVPAPISVVDSMPATMVPQWHRGTEWARDAARDFYDEVRARAEAGEGACPEERIRLMFVGRGVWGDMSFYQRWEESHGAVFVCSMYLSLAADGYIRRHSRGRDPMRALAARFVSMGDELRMPTWAGAWHVKEARLHGVDGAFALTDADPLVLHALRDAGIAVLELGMDNYVRDPEADAEMNRRVSAFLEGPAAAASARRRGV
jgi:hypothetical protein